LWTNIAVIWASSTAYSRSAGGPSTAIAPRTVSIRIASSSLVEQ
jgi:hypothetical protein